MSESLTRTNKYDLLLMPMALFIILWLNYGCFTAVMPVIPSPARWMIYLSWLLFACLCNAKFLRRFIIMLSPLLAFYVIILIGYLNARDGNRLYLNNIAYLIMVYSIFLYYHDERYLKFQRFMAVILILDYIAVGINTYIQLGINPLVARYLSTTPDLEQTLLNNQSITAIGNYGYFYSLAALILLLCFAFINFHKNKMIAALLIAGFTMLLIKASFTIAIIVTFLFLIILFISSIKTRVSKLFCILIIFIVFLVFIGYVSAFFEYLSKISWISKEVAVRFDELSQFFSGNDIGQTDLYSRQQLFLISWNTFLNNPLVGIFGSDMGGYSVVGGHSSWMDMLAAWGLGCLPFFIFLFNAYRYAVNSVQKKFKTIINVYWLYFIVLGVINTLLISDIYVMWFLFLPFMLSALSTPQEINLSQTAIEQERGLGS